MTTRSIEPELLDSLPGNDPRAVHSRRDLRWINAWMGNPRHLGRAIQRLPARPVRVLDLGTGDGTLAGKLKPWLPGVIELTLLDMEPVVSESTLSTLGSYGWQVSIVQIRLEDWLQNPSTDRYDLILANLFLHHFTDAQLRTLLAGIAQRSGAFISCEPRRSAPSLFATHGLWLLGCNAVTRHDARVSVRAGFRNRELSALWPPDSGFHLLEEPAGFASHLFQASRPREFGHSEH
jgi:SAM-dependent methyltransferase